MSIGESEFGEVINSLRKISGPFPFQIARYPERYILVDDDKFFEIVPDDDSDGASKLVILKFKDYQMVISSIDNVDSRNIAMYFAVGTSKHKWNSSGKPKDKIEEFHKELAKMAGEDLKFLERQIENYQSFFPSFKEACEDALKKEKWNHFT